MSELKFLNRDDIISVQDIHIEPLEVPEWGGWVHVKTLTGEERDLLEASMIDLGPQGQTRSVNLRNVRAQIAWLSLCDENGKRLFTKKDLEVLAKKSSAALDRVAEKAQSLAKISQTDLDKMVDGLKKDPPEDSSSG